MANLWQAQSTFAKGELDPLLLGRTDLEAYYAGAEEATNVQCLPQGGLRKRNGFRYIDSIVTVPLGVPYSVRLEAFKFSEELQYLVAFVQTDQLGGHLYFYRDGQRITDINGFGIDFISFNTAPDFIDIIEEMDFIQSANTAIIVTGLQPPKRLVRGATDSDWVMTDIPLLNVPQFNFNDADSPTPVSCIQTLTFTNGNNGDSYKISLEGVLTDEIAYVEEVTARTTNEKNIQQALYELPNTANTGIEVNHASGTTYEVTFSDASASDYSAMSIIPVTTKSTGFEVVVVVTQEGISGEEDVWSELRGWPKTATFHESRLWFGGSPSRPSTVWGSVVNDPFNFNSGRGRDDEGIDATLATDQINTITGIISNRALQIFTSGAEFYVPESPVTPANFSAIPQTNLGSKRVRPAVLEGGTVFIQNTGKALFEFQFINEFQANEARSLSILAPHLISDQKELVVRRGSDANDANYLYLAGGSADLTVFNSNKVEGVQGFTRFTAQRPFGSVAVVDNLLYTATSFPLGDPDPVFFIGVEDARLNTDWGTIVETGGGSTVTGLDHLEGETVKVVADGAVQKDQVVTGGQITVQGPDLNGNIQAVAADVIEVGLEYQPKVKTMPFNTVLKNGPNISKKKRILRCGIQYDNSVGILVNGERLPVKTIGVNQFNAPEPQTGLDRIFLNGWSLTAQVEVTQDTPYDMTILALNLEVSV